MLPGSRKYLDIFFRAGIDDYGRRHLERAREKPRGTAVLETGTTSVHYLSTRADQVSASRVVVATFARNARQDRKVHETHAGSFWIIEENEFTLDDYFLTIH